MIWCRTNPCTRGAAAGGVAEGAVGTVADAGVENPAGAVATGTAVREAVAGGVTTTIRGADAVEGVEARGMITIRAGRTTTITTAAIGITARTRTRTAAVTAEIRLQCESLIRTLDLRRDLMRQNQSARRRQRRSLVGLWKWPRHELRRGKRRLPKRLEGTRPFFREFL